jgi:hypothetical protein
LSTRGFSFSVDPTLDHSSEIAICSAQTQTRFGEYRRKRRERSRGQSAERAEKAVE